MRTQYIDDSTIKDDHVLWRRICPQWIVFDENQDRRRISSAAFDDSRDGSPMSVLLAEIVAETGRTASDILKGFEGYGLAMVTAGIVRSLQQGIARTPQPAEIAHASVFGKKTKSIKSKLATASTWAYLPV